MTDFVELFNNLHSEYDKRTGPTHLDPELEWKRAMLAKWQRVCVEQRGFLPEVQIQIPSQWKRKLMEADTHVIEFLDCSREMAETHIIKTRITEVRFLDCSREILEEAA